VKTLLQAPVTPSEIQREINPKDSGWPGVTGAALEPFGFSPGVSQRELRELEGGFPKTQDTAFFQNQAKIHLVKTGPFYCFSIFLPGFGRRLYLELWKPAFKLP
jgi:hypothetical protein